MRFMLTDSAAGLSKAVGAWPFAHPGFCAAARWVASGAFGLMLLAGLVLLAEHRAGRAGSALPTRHFTLELVRVAVVPPSDPSAPSAQGSLRPASAPPAPRRVPGPPAPIESTAPTAPPMAAPVPAPHLSVVKAEPALPVEPAEPGPSPQAPEPIARRLPVAPVGPLAVRPAAQPQPQRQPEPSASSVSAIPDAAAPTQLVTPRALDAGFRLQVPVAPRYPAAARRLRRAGSVELELEVAPDGRVSALAVREDLPGWGFGAAVREAFAGARFTPPTVRGAPVRVRWRRTLHFRP